MFDLFVILNELFENFVFVFNFIFEVDLDDRIYISIFLLMKNGWLYLRWKILKLKEFLMVLFDGRDVESSYGIEKIRGYGYF